MRFEASNVWGRKAFEQSRAKQRRAEASNGKSIQTSPKSTTQFKSCQGKSVPSYVELQGKQRPESGRVDSANSSQTNPGRPRRIESVCVEEGYRSRLWSCQVSDSTPNQSKSPTKAQLIYISSSHLVESSRSIQAGQASATIQAGLASASIQAGLASAPTQPVKPAPQFKPVNARQNQIQFNSEKSSGPIFPFPPRINVHMKKKKTMADKNPTNVLGDTVKERGG